MELSSLTQYGIAAIFIFATWRLYMDMRDDSKARETKLMEHLDKQADTNEKVASTLERIDMRMGNMDGRICSLETHIKDKKEGEV